MSSDRVVSWVVAAVGRTHPPDRTEDSIPLDRLLGAAYSRETTVADGYETFAEAIRAVRHQRVPMAVRLVLPLEMSESLDITAPVEADLQAAMSRYEPPSLYVFTAAGLLRPSDFEEYRLPLDWSLPGHEGAHAFAYYTCFRDPVARQRGWEYSRCLWWNHYPESW